MHSSGSGISNGSNLPQSTAGIVSTDAAGIPADRVVRVEQLRRQEVDEVPGQLDAGRARSAGIHHERPAIIAGLEHGAGEGDADRRPRRVGVVERRLDGRALPAHRQSGGEVRARRPLEGRRCRRGGGRCRRLCLLGLLCRLLGAHAGIGGARQRGRRQAGQADPRGPKRGTPHGWRRYSVPPPAVSAPSGSACCGRSRRTEPDLREGDELEPAGTEVVDVAVGHEQHLVGASARRTRRRG